jgi:hypothetical protein
MCFFKPPALKPLPAKPTVDDEAVKARQAAEQARIMAGQGTAGTVKTDLNPASLNPGRRVLLGQ